MLNKAQNNQLLLIEKATSLETLLALILEYYQTNGIGADLPVADLEDFWWGKAPLTEAWQQTIAAHLCLDLPVTLFNRLDREDLQKTGARLLKDQPLESWEGLASRWVILFAPLLDLSHLVLWGFLPNMLMHSDDNHKNISKLVLGIKPFAQALASEEAEFRSVCQWLKNAGMSPALWLETVDQSLQDNVSQRFHAVLRTFVSSLALLLRHDKPCESDWFAFWSHFAPILASLNAQRGIHVPALKPQLKALSVALLNQLVDWPLFIPSVLQNASVLQLNMLFEHLDVAVSLTHRPTDFKALIDGLPDTELSTLKVNSALAEASAELALYVMQQRFERRDPNASFFLRGVELSTPEALAYYRQVLPFLKVREEVEQCLRCVAKSQDAQKNRKMLETLIAKNPYMVPDFLFDYVDEQAILAVMAMFCYPDLQGKAVQYIFERALDIDPVSDPRFPRKVPNLERWPWLLELQSQYADLFIQHTMGVVNAADAPLELQRLEVLWSLASRDEIRQRMVWHLLDEIRYTDNYEDAVKKGAITQIIELTERLFLDRPAPFFSCIEDRGERYLDSLVTLVNNGSQILLPLIPSMAVAHLSQSSWFSGSIEALSSQQMCAVNQALQSDAAIYTALSEKGKVKLLPVMDEVSLLACAVDVAALLVHKNKSVYECVIQRLAQCSLATLEQSGWLHDTNKVLRKRLLLSIGLNTNAELLPLWRSLLDDKAHDDFSRGLMLDRLEALGEELAAKDACASMDLAAWQADAQAQKIPASVQKLWQPAFADCLQDCAEVLGPYLLHLLCSGNNEVMPRKARQLLAALPAGYAVNLTEQLVNSWISENGADKFSAFLLPLPIYGDERVANALVKACKAWKKARKAKASQAVQLLCLLPGTYGVSQAHLLWESRQFSDSIMRAAEMGLTEAASREGLSFDEFLEQLVPDLGLSAAGLVLDVGPYCYTVKVKPDLSLMVLDAKGKATKTLPKMKAEEDANKRRVADNQFNNLKKNLKPILKQQSQRLYRLMCVGKRWPVALWQRLFAQHPLMAIIAQGVVWSVYDPKGEPLGRFRPSDGGELLDLDDDTVILADGQSVGVTHPVEIDEAERQAWQAHFDDYEITSPFGQWDIPAYQVFEEELSAKRVTRCDKAMLNRSKFGSLVEKWGYLKGQAEDGAMVHEHSWVAVPYVWQVMCYHTPISVFFEADEEVCVEALVPLHYDLQNKAWVEVTLDQLPKALLATLLSQAEAFNAAKIRDLA